ncbi:MAG TPA: hypothetical protein VFD58_15790 [Blastocatellia bacterium]|nr:hypothetical protein [Blastocatellia bacterium]
MSGTGKLLRLISAFALILPQFSFTANAALNPTNGGLRPDTITGTLVGRVYSFSVWKLADAG